MEVVKELIVQTDEEGGREGQTRCSSDLMDVKSEMGDK